jgi:hypothetical protein
MINPGYETMTSGLGLSSSVFSSDYLGIDFILSYRVPKMTSVNTTPRSYNLSTSIFIYVQPKEQEGFWNKSFCQGGLVMAPWESVGLSSI